MFVKSIYYILTIVFLCGAWYNASDTTYVRECFKYFNRNNNKLTFVKSSDSTLDTTDIIYSPGTKRTEFPDYILFDTTLSVGGIALLNSYKALFYSVGAYADNDSGPFVYLNGVNAPSPGTMLLEAGVNGSIWYSGPFHYFTFGGDSSKLTFAPYPTVGTAISTGAYYPDDKLNINADGNGTGMTVGADTVWIHDTLIVESSAEIDGYVKHDAIGASVHHHTDTTTTSVANGATYTQLTCFDGYGIAKNAIADTANDRIILTENGVYQVGVSVSVYPGTAALTWNVAVFENGTIQNHIHTESKLDNADDVKSIYIMGWIDIDGVPDTIDVRARHTDGSAANLNVTHGHFGALYIGSD